MTNIILHNQAKLTDQLDLKNVIILDNQSTLDIICNKNLTSTIKNLDKKISVQENGGTLTIKYKARMPVYSDETWYSKDEISNIISMKNIIRQYCVIYDSDNETFILHREASALPDMEFRMHKLGIHVFYPEDINNMVLMNTVEEKMKAFTKREAKIVKSARNLYAKLLYPLNAAYKWLIKNNQIKNCEVSVQNIDTTQEIWGKEISALKGKNVQSKPTLVTSDCIKIPKEIANLKNTVFLTAGIFFVNGIPLFISLSIKMDFTGVSHLKRSTEAIISDALRLFLDYIYIKDYVSRSYTRMVNLELSKI